jgi:hypothetical protein
LVTTSLLSRQGAFILVLGNPEIKINSGYWTRAQNGVISWEIEEQDNCLCDVSTRCIKRLFQHDLVDLFIPNIELSRCESSDSDDCDDCIPGKHPVVDCIPGKHPVVDQKQQFNRQVFSQKYVRNNYK